MGLREGYPGAGRAADGDSIPIFSNHAPLGGEARSGAALAELPTAGYASEVLQIGLGHAKTFHIPLAAERKEKIDDLRKE